MKKLTINANSFQQKIRTLYTQNDGLDCCEITALSFSADGSLYIGTKQGLYVFRDGAFSSCAPKTPVDMIYSCRCGKLFVSCASTLYTMAEGKITFKQDFDGKIVKISKDDNFLWLSTTDKIYKYSGETFEPYADVEYGGVTDMTVFADRRIYCANHMGVMAMHGKRPHWTRLSHLTCDLPECRVNAVANDECGYLWVGTDKGVFLYDGYTKWYSSNDLPYLAKGNVKDIIIGQKGTRYITANYGLIIQYGVKDTVLTSGRWLPRGEITAVAVSQNEDEIWVGTDSGLARIEYREMTLKSKADYMQNLLDTYYDREGYFTHCYLEKENDMTSAKPCITDNDGLFTGIYLGVQAYRYAATKDPKAKENCDKAAKALLKLQSITGIDGFTARAYRRPGEIGYGDGYHEFHKAKDEISDLEWRGETSSDEMVGHFFGLSLYFDFVADENQKTEVCRSLCAIVDHAIRNGDVLCDEDGLPTTWAHWGPQELNRDDIRTNERGVNSLEYLMMLKVAYEMSGDKKYGEYYDYLISKEHYALNAARHKIVDKHVMHIDDNLCFLTSLTLFRYEQNPHLRQILFMGLRHHWEYERIERAPLWNIAYGAITGEFCDLDAAIRSLEELPLDMINYEMKNSVRPDIEWDDGQELFDGEPQMKQPLPYDENKLTNFDSNPFLPDYPARNHQSAENPHIYLLPYWLGRYYGLIADDR